MTAIIAVSRALAPARTSAQSERRINLLRPQFIDVLLAIMAAVGFAVFLPSFG